MERVLVALIALALTVAVGCRSEGEAEGDSPLPPVLPRDDPARGIARELPSFDGWTVGVSVEPSVAGPIAFSVGPVRRAPRNNAHPWIQHDLVLENRWKRPVRFADTRRSAFIGHRTLLAADEGCGYSPKTRKPPIEAGVCLLYLDAFRIKPRGSESRTITLFKGLRGMEPLAPGTYVFRKLLRFQLGNEIPEEGTGRSVVIRLVYEIEPLSR